MTIQAATPYFILNGNAEKAIELYRGALGAELESLQRFGDVDESCPEAVRDRVMHAELRAGDAGIMLSDGPTDASDDADGSDASGGSNVSVALAFDDVGQMRSSFDGLAEGGEVVQAIFDAPWGPFGVVRDRFGIHWMFSGPAS